MSIELPILFNGAMVRAILDGRKTVTRRPVSGLPNVDIEAIDAVGGGEYCTVVMSSYRMYGVRGGSVAPSAFGKAGDLLCVRLDLGPCIRCDGRLFADISDDGSAWEYDRCTRCNASWMHSPPRVPLFGPVPLRVTVVRAERLQDITPDQREAEGHDRNAVAWDSWDAIYKAKGYGWDANPWVWVIEFERVER